jgi:hypothetical protein
VGIERRRHRGAQDLLARGVRRVRDRRAVRRGRNDAAPVAVRTVGGWLQCSAPGRCQAKAARVATTATRPSRVTTSG